MIHPIKRVTLSEAVMDQLSNLITNGHFQPGEKLPPERELAQQFGVARGPVREALRALALVGLVHIKPSQGVFVANPNIDYRSNSIRELVLAEIEDIRSVYDARRVIESYLIERATTRINAEQLTELRNSLEAMQAVEALDSTRTEDFANLHYQFDLIVAEAAENRVLLSIFMSIRRIELETHLKVLRLPDAMKNSLIQHQRILAALTAGDVNLAREAARFHFESVERLLLLLDEENVRS